MARGNAVMRAKRTTGPSPNAVLLLAVKTATCSVKGCNNPPLRTIPRPEGVVRHCPDHIGWTGNRQSAILTTGWKPEWMR